MSTKNHSSSKKTNIKELDLYEPIKKYLESNGYLVNAEVQHCDITARKNDELVIIELKTQFSLALVYQAVERQKVCDSVYVAIPLTEMRRTPPNYKKICMLLKRLEVGLLLVHFLKTKQRVELVFHPQVVERKTNVKRKRAILRESSERVGDYNIGGSTSSDKKVTLYKQQAIQLACCLAETGEQSPKNLVKMGCTKKSGDILRSNYYGWFEKVSKGIYKINEHGKNEITKFPELLAFFKDELSSYLLSLQETNSLDG